MQMFIRNRVVLIYELLSKTNPTICLSPFSVSSICFHFKQITRLLSSHFLERINHCKSLHNVANFTGPGFYTNVGEHTKVPIRVFLEHLTYTYNRYNLET